MPKEIKYPDRRPKAPKKFRENYTSDNTHTRSKIEIEYYSGDCYKVILEMCHQLIEIDKYQPEDILAVIKNDIERHYEWEDV